ncbi:hypothetical protein RHMOL_Rhmol01G0242800 [Rhododendron molle]|uniref:Uncharacterized protein n=1 Tax=Rhododendron molle TaxID=49168 RepID=A0ACC0Q6X0_RHOML|nr:hypothetical protein RHMOL_Rhmol01G0242800 [Rhododendron molle]
MPLSPTAYNLHFRERVSEDGEGDHNGDDDDNQDGDEEGKGSGLGLLLLTSDFISLRYGWFSELRPKTIAVPSRSTHLGMALRLKGKVAV